MSEKCQGYSSSDSDEDLPLMNSKKRKDDGSDKGRKSSSNANNSFTVSSLSSLTSSISSLSEDEEDLKPRQTVKSVSAEKNTKLKNCIASSSSSEDDDNIPLKPLMKQENVDDIKYANIKENGQSKIHIEKNGDGVSSLLDDSDSEDGLPLKLKVQQTDMKQDGDERSTDKRKSSPESDNCVPKTNKTSPDSKTSGKRKKYSVSTSGASLSDSESDVNEKAKSAKEPVKKKRKQTVQKDNSSNTDEKENKTRKMKLDSNKLRNLKKYVNACGYKVSNYNSLFNDCKSMKSKEQKLSQMLEDFGIKARPSLKQCKKIKKRREEEKEISELDLSNVLPDSARTRSSRSSRTAPNMDRMKNENQNVQKYDFGKLGDFIESGPEFEPDEESFKTDVRRKQIKELSSSSVNESDAEECEENLTSKNSNILQPRVLIEKI